MDCRTISILKTLTVSRYVLQDCKNLQIIKIAIIFLSISYATGYLLSSYTIGNPLKILVDSALLPFQLFSLYSVLFYTIPFFNRQKSYGLPDFFLFHTLSNQQFFLGTFFAIASLLSLSGIFFCASSLIMLKYTTELWFFNIIPCFLMTALEGLFLVAISLFFSSFLSKEFTYVTVISIYLISYLNSTWLLFIEKKFFGIYYMLGLLVYYLLPDLTLLNIQQDIVYFLPINIYLILYKAIYIALFILIFLYLSNLVTSKKNIIFLK